VGLPPDVFMAFDLESSEAPILEEAIRIVTEAAGG
jgi:hypothetical protein